MSDRAFDKAYFRLTKGAVDTRLQAYCEDIWNLAVEHCKQGEPAGYVSESGLTNLINGNGVIVGDKTELRTIPLFTHAMPKSEDKPVYAQLPDSFVSIQSILGQIKNLGEGITYYRDSHAYDETQYRKATMADVKKEMPHIYKRLEKVFDDLLEYDRKYRENYVDTSQPSTDVSELVAENEKLINAVERSNKALIVLRTVLDVAGLRKGVATAYEMHEDNNKLLCTIRDRQAHREMI